MNDSHAELPFEHYNNNILNTVFVRDCLVLYTQRITERPEKVLSLYFRSRRLWQETSVFDSRTAPEGSETVFRTAEFRPSPKPAVGN